MNNTKRTLMAIAAILMAATLVVGTAGTVTTKTAFAAASNNNSGNTVTIEECKNKGSSSGFDTTLDQECENLICTHPGDGATCVSEGGNATAGASGGAIDPCLNCFTTNLDAKEQAAFIKAVQSQGVSSLEDICRLLETNVIDVKGIGMVLNTLVQSGDVSDVHAQALIKCLLDAGFPFK
jgi:hypothetical protein